MDDELNTEENEGTSEVETEENEGTSEVETEENEGTSEVEIEDTPDTPKVTKFKALTNETSSAVSQMYLEMAEDVLLSHLYYLKERPTSLPEVYDERQVLIAVDLYNKRGAEGELAHSENGISRTYESSWVSKELLADLPRTAGSW